MEEMKLLLARAEKEIAGLKNQIGTEHPTASALATASATASATAKHPSMKEAALRRPPPCVDGCVAVAVAMAVSVAVAVAVAVVVAVAMVVAGKGGVWEMSGRSKTSISFICLTGFPTCVKNTIVFVVAGITTRKWSHK